TTLRHEQSAAVVPLGPGGLGQRHTGPIFRLECVFDDVWSTEGTRIPAQLVQAQRQRPTWLLVLPRLVGSAFYLPPAVAHEAVAVHGAIGPVAGMIDIRYRACQAKPRGQGAFVWSGRT